jgi:hypothetical protein
MPGDSFLSLISGGGFSGCFILENNYDVAAK